MFLNADRTGPSDSWILSTPPWYDEPETDEESEAAEREDEMREIAEDERWERRREQDRQDTAAGADGSGCTYLEVHTGAGTPGSGGEP